MLFYHYLSKQQYSYYYIKNYYKRIKLKFIKYLYGKNSYEKVVIIIKSENSIYKKESNDREIQLITKNVKYLN